MFSCSPALGAVFRRDIRLWPFTREASFASENVSAPFCLMFCCATAEAGSSKFWLFHERFLEFRFGLHCSWDVWEELKVKGLVMQSCCNISRSSVNIIILICPPSQWNRTVLVWKTDGPNPSFNLSAYVFTTVRMPLQGLISIIPFKVWYFLQ